MAVAGLALPLEGQEAAKRMIVIDPGHGGKNDEADSGSTAAENRSDANHAALIGDASVKERLLTLELSKKIAASIAAKSKENGQTVDCVLTRTQDDQNPDFTQRMATAAEAHASLVISIHFNSGEVRSSNGPVCMYPRAAVNPHLERDEKVAKALAETVRKTTLAFEEPGFTTHSACFDDQDLVDRNEHGKQVRPHGSYLFYQARNNPTLRDVTVLYLEVDYLQSKLYQERSRKLFVDRKAEVFQAWADAIAGELISQATAMEKKE